MVVKREKTSKKVKVKYYKYSITFLSSFLFLISKIIRIKRRVKNEKIRNKNTNKKILTYRFGLFLFGAPRRTRTLLNGSEGAT